VLPPFYKERLFYSSIEDTVGSTVNKKQKTVLAIALALMAIAGLFPPWDVPRNNYYYPYSGSGREYDSLFSPRGAATLVIRELAVEWLVILFVATAVMVLTKNRKG